MFLQSFPLLSSLLLPLVNGFPFFTPKNGPISLSAHNGKIIRGEVLCVEIDMVYAPNSSTLQLFYRDRQGQDKLISQALADGNGHFELMAPKSLGTPTCQFYLTASSSCDVLGEKCQFVKTEKVPKSEPDLLSSHPGRHQFAVSFWIRTDVAQPKCNNNTTGPVERIARKELGEEQFSDEQCLLGTEEW